jgi:DNA-binding response OmpR family regulator
MTATAVHNKTVLVVEDDYAVNGKVCDALDSAGFEPVAAFDGDHAVNLAIKHAPSLIILDLNLPDADGVHICRELAKNPATSDIPVIVFTGRTDLTSKFSCFVAGAHSYITKPVDRDSLLHAVRAALQGAA